MLIRNCLNKIITRYSHRIENVSCMRLCSSKNIEDKGNSLGESENKFQETLKTIGSKYKIFQDSDSKNILDIFEEKNTYSNALEEEPQIINPFEGINLHRGVNGVFEIEDLVEVLKRENVEDILVAQLPGEVRYVDYMCVVTGKSYRHMQAIAQLVKRVYKQKRHKNDIVPRLEGQDCKEWMALDLGNIALHIFSREGRVKYDVDTLWALGPEYDLECQKEDPVVEMLERHSVYLKDLKPAR